MSRGGQRRLSVFLVGTEFYRSYGGIQYVNRLLLQAFNQMATRTPLDMELFSYVDGPEHFPTNLPGAANLRWHGAQRRRGALAWKLSKRLAAVRPDLVILTHVSLCPFEKVVRSLVPGARVALLAHGTEVWSPLQRQTAMFLSRVDSFVSPSAFTAEKLAEVHGIHPDRITVIPHGLDSEWMDDSSATASPLKRASDDGRPLLLSVTRLSRADREGKGIDLVLKALPTVAAQFPSVRYRVVGGGAELPRLAELVRSLGLEGRTELPGARGREALRQAYREADIFVLPTQVEGFGVVFLEAMFNRLPVVAVKASATPEVVEDGVTGLLVTPGRSDELADALMSLLADSGLRQTMGEAGRRRIETMYLFEHFVSRWERWLASQVPEALYAVRQMTAFSAARAAAGAA